MLIQHKHSGPCSVSDLWKDQNRNSEMPAEYGLCQLQDKAWKDQKWNSEMPAKFDAFTSHLLEDKGQEDATKTTWPFSFNHTSSKKGNCMPGRLALSKVIQLVQSFTVLLKSLLWHWTQQSHQNWHDWVMPNTGYRLQLFEDLVYTEPKTMPTLRLLPRCKMHQ